MVAVSCGPAPESQPEAVRPATDTSVRYARRFAMAHRGDSTWLYVIGKAADTAAVFVLSGRAEIESRREGSTWYVRRPCTRIASLGSVYTQMFYELGALGAVKAIDNIDYVNNRAVIEKHERGDLTELARTPVIDVEQTLQLRPDMVFAYDMGTGIDARITEAGIPVAVSLDNLEESPLGRAEWIRFFAEFVGRRERADSIFRATEKKYRALQARAAGFTDRPTVLSELRYSDAWYMPGGRSYVAALLRDAGATYLWEDDAHTGSLPLSFEAVFRRAKDADYWIHLSLVRTKNELLAFDSRYAHFKPFASGNLFNNTRNTNAKGYSDYWESGMIHPERILEDLISIFHPASPADTVRHYYEKIE